MDGRLLHSGLLVPGIGLDGLVGELVLEHGHYVLHGLLEVRQLLHELARDLHRLRLAVTGRDKQ